MSEIDDPCGEAMKPHMERMLREFTAPPTIEENLAAAWVHLEQLKAVLERLQNSLAGHKEC